LHHREDLVNAGGPKKQDKGNKGTGTARTDIRYWRKRVIKRSPREGYTTPFYSVQVHWRGKRHRFALEKTDKDEAASKAQAIYLFLLSNGWDATLAKYKPTTVKSSDIATVGELIEAIRTTAGIRPATLNGYAIALRMIASQIEGIGDQPARDADGKALKNRKGDPVLLSRFDYRTGGREAWAKVVDAVRLDKLTPDRIQQWRLAYLARAGNAPDARRRAANSVNAHLRNARTLFSDRALAYVRDKIILPDPLPFLGIKPESKPPTRYISRIDARQILTDAKRELDPTIEPVPSPPVRKNGRFCAPPRSDKLSREQFKVLCLCLLCGLRKREADALLWRQIDFNKGVLKIETTEYFQPKSEDSHAAIDLDDELLALLRGWKAQAKSEFVIESPNPPRYHVHRSNYRCEREFEALNRWLKSKGVTAQKPIHELRKELGAVLASEQGSSRSTYKPSRR